MKTVFTSLTKPLLVFYFDPYRDQHYGATKTRDFKTFTDITAEMSFPDGHKHGTALKVSKSILDGLLKSSASPPSN